MKSPQSQPRSDIFEMILSSASGAPPLVSTKARLARPANEVSNDFVQTRRGEQKGFAAHVKEGQLAVDVYETDSHVIVLTTMAGAETDKIEVYVHNHDLLTIRGVRTKPVQDDRDTIPVHTECFWGKFSRTIVLPTDVNGSESQAEYKNGVLKITIPKQQSSAIPIEIVEE